MTVTSMANTSSIKSGVVAGKILQVVSTTKLDTFTSATSTFTDVTGLSASITPSSTSSKILVNVTVSGITGDASNSGGSGFILLRGSTPIAVSTGGSTYNLTGHLSSRSLGSTAISLNSAAMTLDSPATTSSTTYKVQVSASASTIYVNRDVDNVGSVSTITLMEVAG